jgi:hypothetical protein
MPRDEPGAAEWMGGSGCNDLAWLGGGEAGAERELGFGEGSAEAGAAHT